METASHEQPGPSGLCIEATVAVTIHSTGNGHSTNGSSSDTPVRPRKRQRKPESWKRTVAKTKRARGQEYTSPSSGKTVPARKTGPDCKCKRRCFDRLSESERASILQSFYQLSNKDLQDAHLFGLVHSKPIKRRRLRGETTVKTPRQATYSYAVRVVGRSESVCQKAFASLHGISASRVQRIARASSTSICAPTDKRGKFQKQSRVIQEGTKRQIRQHIKSFPVMNSHYSRGKSKGRKYLSPLLSVAEMHRLYVEKYEREAETPCVKYSLYAKIFNSEFNLTFGNPKTDTCPTCEIFKNRLTVQLDESSKLKVQEDHGEHLNSAERFYSDLRYSTELAKGDCHVLTLTFDFQQNLPLPHIPVGDMFYLQQLWMYVFGIHSCGDNQVTMYCWPEVVAKRGSDEVISCLQHFLLRVPATVNTLCLYSDGCPGQNKNMNVMSYLFTLVSTGRFLRITHTFPVRGHSFLPNDRDFGRTEMRKRKHERIYTCDQWMDVIRKARVRKPFEVVACDNAMFLDWCVHFSRSFKKTIKNTAKRALNISNARVLEYASTHPTEVWVKYSPDGEWHTFSILKRGVTPTLPQPATSQKYKELVAMKEKKAIDLKKIVEKYVPTEFKGYYEAIMPSTEASSETD